MSTEYSVNEYTDQPNTLSSIQIQESSDGLNSH
jgi:hypothetical protein